MFEAHKDWLSICKLFDSSFAEYMACSKSLGACYSCNLTRVVLLQGKFTVHVLFVVCIVWALSAADVQVDSSGSVPHHAYALSYLVSHQRFHLCWMDEALGTFVPHYSTIFHKDTYMWIQPDHSHQKQGEGEHEPPMMLWALQFKYWREDFDVVTVFQSITVHKIFTKMFVHESVKCCPIVAWLD